MCAEIPGHVVDIRSEVGAVVEVYAAQEVLVGLAGAGVGGRNQTGHHFQQFCRAQDGADRQVGAADRAFAGGARNADLLLGAAEHEHRLRLLFALHDDL